jgi:hypothetical protein
MATYEPKFAGDFKKKRLQVPNHPSSLCYVLYFIAFTVLQHSAQHFLRPGYNSSPCPATICSSLSIIILFQDINIQITIGKYPPPPWPSPRGVSNAALFFCTTSHTAGENLVGVQHSEGGGPQFFFCTVGGIGQGGFVKPLSK